MKQNYGQISDGWFANMASKADLTPLKNTPFLVTIHILQVTVISICSCSPIWFQHVTLQPNQALFILNLNTTYIMY